MSNFEVRKDRLGDKPISHTKKNDEKSVRMMEEESYPETRERFRACWKTNLTNRALHLSEY